MLQGTGSDVGKSLLVAALCRLAARQGLRVAPFKPQNMSNNAAACPDGGEIGRAQALQARAAGITPSVDHNPVLLKPESNTRARIVVHGKALASQEAAAYMAGRSDLLPAVLESFHRLARDYDLIIVEGAGSPAEINLRRGDIANMGFARAAGVPVCLIGDIDRGGVIASIVGTQAVLAPDDARQVRSFLVNKFRGDPRLFDDGIRAIEERTGWPCRGLIPWMADAARLPAEDAVALDQDPVPAKRGLLIVAPLLSRIANFDDADPLIQEPGVDFRWIVPGDPLPRDADVVLLFGSKSTLGELAFLREQGWDHDIIAHARAGGRVLGICGGLQMLGLSIDDPYGCDGGAGSAPGLGLLNVHTTMSRDKTVAPREARCALTGAAISAYEIHQGQSSGDDAQRPMALIDARGEGSRSRCGRIEGTYLHGLFTSDAYRSQWLRRAGLTATSDTAYESRVEEALDRIADGLAEHGDLDRLLGDARPPGWLPGDEGVNPP
mgnify:CR=1 FL=1